MKRLFTKLAFVLFLVAIISVSCKRNNPQPPVDNTFEGLVIDPSFTFETNKQIEANFTIIPYLEDEKSHIITIYQSDPAAGGRMLNKGITNDSYNYTVTFKLADRVDKIYVENRSSDGIYELIEIPLSGNIIDHTFNTEEYLHPPKTVNKTVVVDPGCGNNCDESISGTYSSFTLKKNTDYCVVEGSNLTVSNQLIFESNSSIVICGSASIRQFGVPNNKTGKVYISGAGVLTTSGDLNINDKVHIYNFGIYNISGTVNTKSIARFYNYGLMNISGMFNNNTMQFINEGSLNLSGHYNGNSNSRVQNYGTMIVSGHMNVNSNGQVFNYCSLTITGNLNNNFKVFNDSYISVGNTLTINGSAHLNLRNASLISTSNLMVNGQIKGQTNKYSKILVSGITTINSSGSVRQRVDLCDENGIETNNGTITNTVVFCEMTIPADECNPGSEGETGDDDTDSDGVPDVDDDYPFDAERAFSNYYPNETDFASFAFEDLWPGMGDYDFNDLVVDFNYKIVTNAQNLIVDIITRSSVRAVGASLNNGFGISFPIESSRCASVEGFVDVTGTNNLNAIGYENGHTDNTVVILYDAINTIYGSSIFNTVPGGNTVEPDTIVVTAYFSDPQIGLGSEPYNPFIYVDQERGKEIHMIDHAPTSLANPVYFGTYHDKSDAQLGKWYLTDKYLPWVIETPVSFEYPVEKVDILSAYLNFKVWAESSGTLYQDWYLDEPGYRNDDNIYDEVED